MGKIKNIIGKKGIFFTFIAITMMTLFILVFTPQSDVSLQKDTKAVANRIASIDNYADDLQGRYFEAVLRASGYKTMVSLIYYMNTTGLFLTSMDSSFKEVLINGTINSVPIDTITGKKIMENNTFMNWSSRIIQASRDTLGVNTSVSINNVSIFQTGPFYIDAEININYSVQSSLAVWNKSNVTIITSISIEDLYDPYYLMKTNGLYDVRIKRSSVEFNKWNVSILREHLRNGTYVHWQNSQAPSFLMRLTNTPSNSSCCGIESLVNPNKVSPGDQIKSYVDYQFWDPAYNIPCANLFNITNRETGGGVWDEFNYFKMEANHTVMYNITAFDAVRTC